MTRQAVSDSGDFNRVYGLDAYIRFPSNIDWSTYVLETDTPGKDGGEYAWRTSLNRESNFTHVKFGLMELGEGFQNDIGFNRRVGVRKYFLDTGIRPRPEWMRERGVREMHPHIVWNYYEDLDRQRDPARPQPDDQVHPDGSLLIARENAVAASAAGRR